MSHPIRSVALAVVLSIAVPSWAHAQLERQPYVTGLSFPVAFIADPTSPSRQFVVEQMGHIRVVVNGVLLAADFLDVQALVTPRTPIEAERGLLGMVLAPDYSTSGRFFIAYTRIGLTTDDPNRGDLVISRYTRSADDPRTADQASRFDLRWGGPSGRSYIEHSARPSHNGGAMVFGPDGYLYIGVGDGGGNGDPDNNAQNPIELKGKILRIDVNVADSDAQGYAVPPDNPFVDDLPIDALPEIWAFGVRNPWRFTFDDPALGGTGALLVADVGQDRWEEINYEPAGEGGRNYGWKIREGANAYYDTQIPNYQAPPPAFLPLTDPAFEYFHSIDQSPVEGYSVTGGYVYRGHGLGDAMRGRYFFSDFSLARIWSARITPVGSTATLSDIIEHTNDVTPEHMSSFAVDQSGELYLVTYGGPNQGLVSRLCRFTVTESVTSFADAGGIGSIRVTAPAGCAWSASVNAPWITLVSNEQNTGSGVVVFRAAPYDADADRETTLTLAGRTIRVTQRPSAPVLGDIDGTGSADILWQHGDGRISAWLMQGLTVVDGTPFGPGSVADPAWRIAASGDFDRDGNRDVVWQHQANGQIALWLMSGTTLLAGVSLGQVPATEWKIQGAADMNQDGWTDLVWRHTGDGRLSVWLMHGTGVMQGLLLSPEAVADLAWQVVGAADMNADGHSDLIWQNQSNGLICVWLMDRTTLVEGVWLSPPQVVDTSWRIRGVGDFNGDAMPDLLWQQTDTGLVSVWLMNDLSLIDGVLLTANTAADTGWQIVGPR